MSSFSHSYGDPAHSGGSGLLRLARATWFAAPALARTAIALLVLSLPVLLLPIFDDRLFQGVSVWLKPWKFLVSIGTYLLTLAVVFAWLPQGSRPSLAKRYVVWASVVSGLFEIGYITWQAAWGQGSHFNFSSPSSILMYSLMGVGAVTLTSTALVQGVMVLRSPAFALPPALQQGIGWGLVLTFGLGTGFGGYLSASPTGHWIGGQPSDGAGLAVVQWARDGGDLRVAHFFGIHAVHFIALFAWGLVVFARHVNVPGLSGHTQQWVWAFCAAYSAFCLWTFQQAVRGQPFLA